MRQIWQIWNTPSDESLAELMREGSLELERGNWERSIEIFSAIIERDPEFAEGWNKRATAYYQRARDANPQTTEFAKRRDFDASIRDVVRVLRLEPRHFAALSGMGLIYSELGADAPALRWFERALEVNPFLANVPKQIQTLRQRIRRGEI